MKTKKRKVDFSDESIQTLMQETYHETVDIRNRALIAYRKYTKDVNEITDIAMVGKITNELLKIVDGSVEKKLRLLKLQIDIRYKDKSARDGDGSDEGKSATISAEDRKMVEEMLKNGFGSDIIKTYE